MQRDVPVGGDDERAARRRASARGRREPRGRRGSAGCRAASRRSARRQLGERRRRARRRGSRRTRAAAPRALAASAARMQCVAVVAPSRRAARARRRRARPRRRGARAAARPGAARAARARRASRARRAGSRAAASAAIIAGALQACLHAARRSGRAARCAVRESTGRPRRARARSASDARRRMTARDRQRRRQHAPQGSGPRAADRRRRPASASIALILVAGVALRRRDRQQASRRSAQLRVTTYGQASTVYAADGSRAGPDQGRRSCASRSRSTQMPAYLREATVAIEDHGFYQHGAIDYLSLIRAAITDLTSGQTLQGGSTITMQLVRNLYPARRRRADLRAQDQGGDRRHRASRSTHSKLWILTDYLNTVPYGTVGGQTAEGVAGRLVDVLRPPGLAGHPRPVGAARRACRRRRRTTTRSTTRATRSRAATRCCAAMAQYGYITPRAAAGAPEPQAARRRAQQLLQGHPRHATSSTTSRSELLRALRRRGARGGRPEGLHDDQPAPERARQAGDRRACSTCPATPRRRSSPRTPTTATSTRWRSRGATPSRSTTSRRRPSASRARRSRRSSSPTRSRAASTRSPPTTSRTRSSRAGCPGYPTYTVTIDGGGSLNAPLNLDQALVASDNTVFAQLAADLGEPSVTRDGLRAGRRAGHAAQLSRPRRSAA